MRLKPRTFVVSVLAGTAYGLVARLLFSRGVGLASNGVMTFAFLVLVPTAVGFVSVAFGHEETEERTGGALLLLPLITVLFCLAATMAFGLEGMICLVLILPIFLGFASLGGLIAVAARRWARGRRMNAAVAGAVLLLPYLALPVENRIPLPDTRRTVENRVRIHADAQTVWRNIERVPPIRREEYGTSFIHLIGFPRPIEATLSREGVGGVRKASFERGVVFRETVVEWRPGRRLSFTIAVDTIPTASLDEHVSVGGDFFDVLDGTYEIVPVAPGEVELRLSSTHRLSTHFNPYAAFWTDLVMRQVQHNILRVVRARAEAGR